MMPTDLRIWLSEKKPTTSREAGKLADEYYLARQRQGRDLGGRTQDSQKQGASHHEPRKCYLCGQPGHWVRNCPKRGAVEHTSEKSPPTPTDPPAQRETNSKPQPDKKCYNRHKQGHLANRCPSALYCGTVLHRRRVRVGVARGQVQ